MGAIGGIFSSSHSSTRGAPICSLGATVEGRSPVPDCCAITASDSASLLASKAPTSNERADRAGPAARPSHGNRQTPIASVTIANAQLMDRCLTCTFLTEPSLITEPQFRERRLNIRGQYLPVVAGNRVIVCQFVPSTQLKAITAELPKLRIGGR
jgi:hypothetical protein